MIWVVCLETNEKFGYSDKKTPYEALSGMLYALNMKRLDSAAAIQTTKSGEHLHFEHSGKTYAIRNEQKGTSAA